MVSMTKTFHIIEYGVTDGRERIVGICHQTRGESAGAERAVATAATIAAVAADGCYRVVVEYDRDPSRPRAGREIAVVGANGPVEA